MQSRALMKYEIKFVDYTDTNINFYLILFSLFKKIRGKIYLPGEGEALDNELLLIEFILWGVPIWLKELRRGARGVAVGVVEADEAAELLRL